ncbi:MAG TPA: hypothetical protein EYH30_01310, partial [Anaerolineales bacterium]|nr:hypothetical protein [Anaerolineales bacterium]
MDRSRVVGRSISLSMIAFLLIGALLSADGNVRAVGVEGDGQAAGLEPRRRVYAPYFSGEIEWAEAGLFWFGRVDPPEDHSGQNYVDVRVAYTAEELVLRIAVEDYYLWYDPDATSTSDLTQYDGVAVYLDTAHDGAGAPQPDDYSFLSALYVWWEDGSAYSREARGTGAGWDTGWEGNWTAGDTRAQWFVDPGYNDDQWDYGWWTHVHVPWSTLGLSGPPSEGTIWGLGVQLYDRDAASSSGIVPPEYWPETFGESNPSTWGELAFGLATYTPEPAMAQRATVIRRGLAGTVEDAYVGG